MFLDTLDKGCRFEDVASWAVVDVAYVGSPGIVTQEAGKASQRPRQLSTCKLRRWGWGGGGHRWCSVDTWGCAGDVLPVSCFTGITYVLPLISPVIGSHCISQDPEISANSWFFQVSLIFRVLCLYELSLHYMAWLHVKQFSSFSKESALCGCCEIVLRGTLGFQEEFSLYTWGVTIWLFWSLKTVLGCLLLGALSLALPRREGREGLSSLTLPFPWRISHSPSSPGRAF